MKQKDLLKLYIEKHRKEFETAKAPEFSWEKIENILETELRTGWKRKPLVWIGVGLLVAALAYFVLKSSEGQDERLDYQEYADLDDYDETENYFITQSDFLWEEIKKVHTDATLEIDLDLLDENEKNLREELAAAQDDYRGYVIKAILRNHEMKMKLLQNVLEEIKQNNIKNTNHEIL